MEDNMTDKQFEKILKMVELKIIKKKNPSRPHICWGYLFCTNLTQPTGALDHKATEQLIFLLKKLNKEGKTIVVVTHDMEMARSGTKQFYMEDGKIFPL